MPWRTEHRARLRDPAGFDPKSFRRTKDGTIYGKIRVPATVSVVWGKLKGHNKPSDYPIPQALAFPVKNWTAEKARAWLKKNKIRVLRFEPAAPEKKGEMPGAIRLAATAEVRLPAAAKEGEKPGAPSFTIRGYTGKPMKIGFYGLVVLDLETMKAAPSLPVLLQHDVQAIVGQATKVSISQEGVVIEGVVTGDAEKDGDPAAKVVSHARKGFNWGASIQWDQPGWEEIAAGQTVTVNGRVLHGPILVGRNSLLRECSFVVLGADDEAEARVAAGAEIDLLDDEENGMTEEREIIEGQDPAGASGEEVDQRVQAGIAADRKRIADITAALEGERFAEIRKQAAEGDMSLEAAKAAGFEVLKAAVTKLEGKLAEATERAAGLERLLADRGVDASKLAFDASDKGAAAGEQGDDGRPESYEARVETLMAEKKLSLAKARIQAGKEMPKAHEAWVAATQPSKK